MGPHVFVSTWGDFSQEQWINMAGWWFGTFFIFPHGLV
jgi:hypothetical protein